MHLHVDSLDYFQCLAVVMAMVALVPLLVDDKFGAGRPPFADEFIFGELPMMAFVADTQRKPVAATPFTNLYFVAQVAVEAPAVPLFWILFGPVWYQRAASSMLHVTNSGPARHRKS